MTEYDGTETVVVLVAAGMMRLCVEERWQEKVWKGYYFKEKKKENNSKKVGRKC